MEEQVRIEEALHWAEQRYRHIFENAMEGIFEAGTDGRFTSANPALAHLHGYDTPAELIEAIDNIRGRLFIDPDRHRQMIALLKKQDSVRDFEARMRARDGSEHWVSINVRAFKDARGWILFYEGTMMDITTRKEAEKALAESEERYRTVIEHSNDGIAITRGGIHKYVNSRFVEMFGYKSPEDVVNKPITMIVHPDDKQWVMEMHTRRLKGQPVPPRYEFKGITASGGTIYVEVSAASITFRNRPVILIFLRDVTERKRAEEVFLESHRELERLNRAKTKAVNHISHELKTPMAVIHGNIWILRRRLEGTADGETLRPIFDTMERNVERLSRMQREADEILRTSQELEAGGLVGDIDRLRDRLSDFGEIPAEIVPCLETIRKWAESYAPRAADAFQSIDLYPFLQQAVERARHAASHRSLAIGVEGDPGAGIWILTDPSVFREVIDGLLRNAIENTPDGGSVTVSVEEREEDVLVHVKDTGVGISEENQQYIFDGLFHPKETEIYASRQPYDFFAGGKGLDLLRMKFYAERFGFTLSVKSTRCPHLPSDADVCPGSMARCPYHQATGDCAGSGSTFTVAFIRNPERPKET
jgi:PAS domain S-box-containing protein